MNKFNLFFVLTSIVCCSIVAPLAHADEDPYYKNNPGCVIDRGNPERTGVYNEKLSDHPKILWQTAASSLYTPICADNLIITDPLMAFNSMNGKKMWDASANTGDHNYPPVYYKGVIYSDQMFSKEKDRKKSRNLLKYDPKTGKLLYQKRFDTDSAAGLFIYNNIAYLSLSNGLTAFDLKADKILWKAEEYPQAEISTISTDGKILFFNAQNGGVHALDIKNGKLLWKENDFFETDYITVGKDNIYVIYQPAWDYKKNIVAYNKKTGKIIWHRSFINFPGFSKKGQISAITLHKNKLFFSNVVEDSVPFTNPTRYLPAGGGVYALDAQMGKVIWHKEIAPFTAPISMNNTLYVGGQNILYALDEDTGKERWHLNVNDDVMRLVPFKNKLFLKLGMYMNGSLLAIY